MAENLLCSTVPIQERTLREIAKVPSRFVPNLAEHERPIGLKDLHGYIGPLLDTADVADLSPSHRAAACNALCAVIEFCQASNVENVQNIILDDSIWFRLFEIYLQRSDNAKGKSMRQMLQVLTNVLLKHESTISLELRDRATSTFIEIVCNRQDRIKVKPALQGLAYFLLKNVVSIPKLSETYQRTILGTLTEYTASEVIQSLFRSILIWIVHHDTSLSAGHVVKNFLGSLRQESSTNGGMGIDTTVSPLWIRPVAQVLHLWPDRIQEFKTHVFPHCFLPNIAEYLSFLSYIHFGKHIHTKALLPEVLQYHNDHMNDLDTFEEFRILLAAIQTGKELGIVKDADYRQHNAVRILETVVYLPDDLFNPWLSSLEPEVRLAGLFLSVYSTAVTKPITGAVFRSLKRNLVHLCTDTDANFRKELLNQVQRLFDRLKGSTVALAKSKTNKRSEEEYRIPFSTYYPRKQIHVLQQSVPDELRESLEFILWYIHFLHWELRSTASYQRRITALRSLAIVLRSGLDPDVPYRHLSKSAQGQLRWAHKLKIANMQLLKSLLNLALDPFDDIRSTSVSILELCLDSLQGEEKVEALSALLKCIRRAEAMMLRTGRADQADGVARAYALLFTQSTEELPGSFVADEASLWTKTAILHHLTSLLEETIALASNDLTLAVSGRPVHGIFAALRYIIDQESFYVGISLRPSSELVAWKQIHERICTSLTRLWDCIRDVLCADAPEGHVPEDLEEETSLDTKEVLSYSWRGLKEASILLRTIISKVPIGKANTSFLAPENVETFGVLCFTQLVELRHRGAFATVAQTFAAICRRCVTVDDPVLRALPEKWYQETLLCIQDKATSITRRSAGIPSLMTGIVAADQQPDGVLFIRAMKDLTLAASSDAESANIEESRLPQVHALNCIKDIFTSSKLSTVSEAYIGEGLNLAARTLNSHIWPIRNCSLMLFKALIERLLGSDEAQDWKDQDRGNTSRFSYDNYPSLAGILVDLLDPEGRLQKSMATTTENTPMDLHGAEGVFPALQILRQAPPPEAVRDVITKSVLHLLDSPHWHLRDMAARTLVSLYQPNEFQSAIKMLMDSINGSHNSQHGLLLGLKHLLRKYIQASQPTSQDSDILLLELLKNACASLRYDRCPLTRAAWLEVINLRSMQKLQSHHVHGPELATLALASDLALDTQNSEDREQGDALLRISIQRFLVTEALTVDPSSDNEVSKEAKTHILQQSLLKLSRNDPDTCCHTLELLGILISTADATIVLDVPKPALLNCINILLLQTHDWEVKSTAQSVMAGPLLDEKLRRQLFEHITIVQVINTLNTLEHQCLDGPPSNMQSALQLLGLFLDFTIGAYPEREQHIMKRFVPYIRLLRMAIIDTNPFDTRYSAVQSISGLDKIWYGGSGNKSQSALVLALALVLYDMLNDDDDEIRNDAASVTSKLLHAQGFNPTKVNAVPIIAVQQLAKFLTKCFNESSDLCREALRRLVGVNSSSRLFAKPLADILVEESKEDTALFSQEKQNLFKDDVMDVALWSNVLKALPPSTAPKTLVMELSAWVLGGLSALSETARKEIDGPLGWTSKAEVFVLGMRVISAADVLVNWNCGDASLIKLALRKFADVGTASEMNALWLEKIEHVLEKSVFQSIGQGRHYTAPPILSVIMSSLEAAMGKRYTSIVAEFLVAGNMIEDTNFDEHEYALCLEMSARDIVRAIAEAM